MNHRGALLVLGASCFVYVTAETIPVGLLPQIADGLSVSEADVGLLLTSYAVVAALSTIPLTALTMRVPRHLLIAATVAIFAISQLIAVFAATFTILTLSRLICAMAHGVFWSTIAPVAARLVPPGSAGRATALVFLGNSLAIVLGVPLGTALGQWLGWRVAFAVLAGAGAICAVAVVAVLPRLPALPRDLAVRAGAQLRASIRIIRRGPVAVICLVTAVLVTGHFAAYTYIAPLVRRDGGLEGAGLSALLLGYGAAGLLGNWIVGRFVDRHPRTLLVTLAGIMIASLVVLIPALGAAPTVLAALAWGGVFTATPVILQAAILRVAPDARDAASAVYVVAFQVGIGGGALLGERFVRAGLLAWLPALAALLALAAVLVVLASRRTFPAHLPAPEEVPASA
ncbi:MFS transporter [Amorphoplanes digitatis]|uniref:Putative MFS family arabinose efflux permease n=1 Tax=Actinoplanes digitatis TaxID=1868 RepID=A0A7W7HRU8_9ACTN|nr:MFS transporter [Actinoplanes digitatis]MBB4759528.1 putative MFS family arabinose efflux permease [Actinoplanes digitatis]GID94925.1 MFS transporter [Actinoplanes digitatis]